MTSEDELFEPLMSAKFNPAAAFSRTRLSSTTWIPETVYYTEVRLCQLRGSDSVPHEESRIARNSNL